MATANPFDLLVDDDNDDPSQLIAVQQQKIAPKKAPAQAASQPAKQPSKPAAKLPSKPAPPAQAVREANNEGARGGGRGGGRGYGGDGGRGYGGGGGRGYGGRGYNRDYAGNENSFNNSGYAGGRGAVEETESGRTSERRGGYGGPRGYRGGRGGYSNEGEGDRTRRVFERHSGTGRGNEYKREGSGRGNWGTQTDELPQVTEEVGNEGEKKLDAEKPVGEEEATDGNKEKPANETEEKLEDKEMTLEEYQKVLEEKRKALEALKTEERKVEIDKELASMQQLSNKKSSDEIFVKLGSDKDKRKEIAEREERAKKTQSINEFLKPAEGDKYYSPGGRGRGRGRGSRGGGSGGGGMSSGGSYVEAPAIEDRSHFPTLGSK